MEVDTWRDGKILRSVVIGAVPITVIFHGLYFVNIKLN